MLETYHGTISLGKDHTETIRATIKSLGEEHIENHVYRWNLADVTTSRENGQDYREAARVLIDAAAYDDSGAFEIKQGWIAYGNKESVFEIPLDGNLESPVDIRLPLQRKLELNRIGVSDVLSMLFNAELGPTTKISQLRTLLADRHQNP